VADHSHGLYHHCRPGLAGIFPIPGFQRELVLTMAHLDNKPGCVGLFGAFLTAYYLPGDLRDALPQVA
jgi:hypothetical protein